MRDHVRWTTTEVDAICAAGDGAAEAASPRRSAGAVRTLVADLHDLHEGRRPRHLSRALQRYLASQEAWRCPRCGGTVRGDGRVRSDAPAWQVAGWWPP